MSAKARFSRGRRAANGAIAAMSRTGQEATIGHFLNASHPIRIIISYADKQPSLHRNE